MIRNYLFSLIGVAILSVLVDMIASGLSTGKFIKMIMGFLVMLVVISPLKNILNFEFNMTDNMQDVLSKREIMDKKTEQENKIIDYYTEVINKEQNYNDEKSEVAE